jgi:methionyl-tRNA formyltransferase
MARMSFRSVFFGTPAFAVPCLEALSEISEVQGVVCQPDKPQGRGHVLAAPPVKERALALGLEVYQPTKVRNGELRAWLAERDVDVALVVAYGRILPGDVLRTPKKGCVNVHASLLPKYRGAAPITWAVVNGEAETGITLMNMDEGMDTGDMLEKLVTPIGPDETAGELSERLSALGALAVRKGLPKVVAGGYVPEPQDHARASAAPLLTKRDGLVDFTKPALAVHNHVRGMAPWPGAFTYADGKVVKVLETRMSDARKAGALPGEVIVADKSGVLVACGEGTIELLRVQLEGKKPVRGAEWQSGRGVREGTRLGEPA